MVGKPARLIWYGLTLQEDPNVFFGGVVLFDKPAFEQVNVYPSVYWGWGPEDLELGRRCHIAGFGFEKRDGTYLSLPHPHAGFAAPGVWTEEARQTHAIYYKRRDRLAAVMSEDGLSSLKFTLAEKRPVVLHGQPMPGSFHYIVDIGEPEAVEPALP